MEGGSAYDSSNMTSLLQSERPPCSSEVLESLWMSNSSPSFHGSSSMVNFKDAQVEKVMAKDRPFFLSVNIEENGNEDYDGCFQQPEKKRRLAVDQVQFLEKSFEVENKLEPERKIQLAKELGLQPRQVAIWFQNRRARYKTKQLEKDYDCLKASYDNLKSDFDSLLKENENLKNEVNLLRGKLIIREKGNVKSEPFDHPINPEPQEPIPNTVVLKQEDASSAKSGVCDSDSPHYTDLEPADSSHVFEPDQSDFSQDEEDNLSRSFLPPPYFPKLEDVCYNDLPGNSCNLGCPVEDQAFWFWSY